MAPMEALPKAHVQIPRGDKSYAVEVGLRNLRRRQVAIDVDGKLAVSEADRPLMEYYAASIRHLLSREGAARQISASARS